MHDEPKDMDTMEVLKTIEIIFSENLKEIRRRAGFAKQDDLAHVIGVTPSSIRAWEQKINLPELASMNALIQALKVHPSELFADPDYVSDSAVDKVFEILKDAQKISNKLGLDVLRALAALDDREIPIVRDALGRILRLEKPVDLKSESHKVPEHSNKPKKTNQ